MAAGRRLLAFKGTIAPLARIIRDGLALVLIALVIYYIAPRKKSFTVFASTEYLVVEAVNDNSPDWEVPRILLCQRSDAEDQTISIDIPGCDNGLYSQYDFREAAVRWSAGYTLTFQGTDKDFVLVRVSVDENAAPVILDGYRQKDGSLDYRVGTIDYDAPISQQITNGSLLRIPFNDGERPLLPMRGRITIGDVPNGRQSSVMREARYEIRQTLGLTRRPTVVASGTFFPGDRIGFASQREPLWYRALKVFEPSSEEIGDAQPDVVATLFVTDLSRLSPAFDLVATSPAKFSNLRLTRTGTVPTIIPVTWTQRLAADTIPVAFATLLGLLATAIAVSNAYFSHPAPQKPAKGKQRSKGDADPSGDA